MFAATSCKGFKDCFNNERLICCPKTPTLSGRSTLDLITGGFSVPSLKETSILEGLRTSNEAVALKEKSAKGLESVVELSIMRLFVSID